SPRSLLFSFMRPPQPPSTLFPYTTLFRSAARSGARRSGRCTRQRHRRQAERSCDGRGGSREQHPANDARGEEGLPDHLRRRHDRSEEHTSELQSLRHLVCRLLLEKKKKKK